MRRLILMIGIWILSFGISGIAAELPEQLRVALEIAPQTTLPGIPVAFRISFTNPTEMPIDLPPHALLIATNDAGETFPVELSSRRIFPMEMSPGPVPAGGSKVLEIRPRGSFNDEPYWLNEPRLNRPGKFQIHVIAGKFMGRLIDVPEGGIRSSDVQLHVIEPTGIDLDVWREMSKAGKGRWSEAMIASPAGWALAAHIVRDFPDSQYAGWFAARGISEKPHESAEALRAWLGRASRDQYTEGRELRLALFDEAAAQQWTEVSDDQVGSHLRNARALLERLKDSGDTEIAVRARRQSGELAQIEETTRERGPRKP